MITTLEGDKITELTYHPCTLPKQKNQLMTDLTTQITAKKNPKSISVVVTQPLLNLIAKHAARTHGFQNGLRG
jgi:hypothetical protein